MPDPVLVIACGALAREIQALKRLNGWEHLSLRCLDAQLHNRPELIPECLRTAIRAARPHFEHIFVAYADCGTGGMIDRVLQEEGGIERLPGPHCYAFFAGLQRFAELADAEPGTFYLTDFLVRHFDRLVLQGLKLTQYPELRDAYFGNYRRVVYLSQHGDEALLAAAHAAAAKLGLPLEHEAVGYGLLADALEQQLGSTVPTAPTAPTVPLGLQADREASG